MYGNGNSTTLESNVRSYCRRFRGVISHASGSTIRTDDGKEYLDFLLGAGSLNYGHNHPELMHAVTEYLSAGGPLHSLDFRTEAKEAFMDAFASNVLKPRGLDYRLQFTGPTGTNAVEAAVKLARKVTGRRGVVAFSGAFHGMTTGSLALSARACPSHLSRHDVVRMPYEGFLGPNVDTMDVIEGMFEKAGSGVEAPAAFIVETVQGDGGLNVMSSRWGRRLRALADSLGSLLIVDDIQAGCGRTGTFFSFEPLGFEPDIVCLSKSLSASGMPMALLLLAPQLDQWAPGEHSGTFRGNCLAFVTAAAASRWWRTEGISKDATARADRLAARLDGFVDAYPMIHRRKGRGLFQGLEFSSGYADRTADEAYLRGLVIETAGAQNEVLKLMPAVNIELEELDRGLDILEASVEAASQADVLAAG